MRVAKSKNEIDGSNLKVTCWLNGFSVTSLAQHLGYVRETMHFAVRWPERYPIAYQKICEALPRRKVTND